MEGYSDSVKFTFGIDTDTSAQAVMEQLAQAVESTQDRISKQFIDLVDSASAASLAVKDIHDRTERGYVSLEVAARKAGDAISYLAEQQAKITDIQAKVTVDNTEFTQMMAQATDVRANFRVSAEGIDEPLMRVQRMRDTIRDSSTVGTVNVDIDSQGIRDATSQIDTFNKTVTDARDHTKLDPDFTLSVAGQDEITRASETIEVGAGMVQGAAAMAGESFAHASDTVATKSNQAMATLRSQAADVIGLMDQVSGGIGDGAGRLQFDGFGNDDYELLSRVGLPAGRLADKESQKAIDDARREAELAIDTTQADRNLAAVEERIDRLKKKAAGTTYTDLSGHTIEFGKPDDFVELERTKYSGPPKTERDPESSFDRLVRQDRERNADYRAGLNEQNRIEISKAPGELSKARDLDELLAMPGGSEWWSESRAEKRRAEDAAKASRVAQQPLVESLPAKVPQSIKGQPQDSSSQRVTDAPAASAIAGQKDATVTILTGLSGPLSGRDADGGTVQVPEPEDEFAELARMKRQALDDAQKAAEARLERLRRGEPILGLESNFYLRNPAEEIRYAEEDVRNIRDQPRELTEQDKRLARMADAMREKARLQGGGAAAEQLQSQSQSQSAAENQGQKSLGSQSAAESAGIRVIPAADVLNPVSDQSSMVHSPIVDRSQEPEVYRIQGRPATASKLGQSGIAGTVGSQAIGPSANLVSGEDDYSAQQADMAAYQSQEAERERQMRRTPEARVESVHAYTGAFAEMINTQLRTGEPAPHPDVNLHIENLDEEFRQRQGIQTPQRLHRAFRDPELMARLEAGERGFEYTDPGFMSTSKSEDIAFRGDFRSKPIHMTVDAPAGASAIDLGENYGIDWQEEVLLNRGSKLRIGDAEKVDGKWRVSAQAIAQGQAAAAQNPSVQLPIVDRPQEPDVYQIQKRMEAEVGSAYEPETRLTGSDPLSVANNQGDWVPINERMRMRVNPFLANPNEGSAQVVFTGVPKGKDVTEENFREAGLMNWSMNQQTGHARIDDTYLHDQFRGQGVMKQAFPVIEEHMKSFGAQGVSAHVVQPEVGQKVWSPLGFQGPSDSGTGLFHKDLTKVSGGESPVNYSLAEGSLQPESFPQISGGKLTADQIGRLAGAPSGSQLKLGDYGGMMSVSVAHPSVSVMERFLSADDEGRLAIENAYVRKSDDAPAGFYKQSIQTQVEAARELGVSQIGSSGDKGATFNGYYTLPATGYDASLSETQRAKLPQSLASAGTVQDLFGMPGGREWWKEHGEKTRFAIDPQTWKMPERVPAVVYSPIGQPASSVVAPSQAKVSPQLPMAELPQQMVSQASAVAQGAVGANDISASVADAPAQRPTIKLPIVDRPQEPDVYQISRSQMESGAQPITQQDIVRTQADSAAVPSIPQPKFRSDHDEVLVSVDTKKLDRAWAEAEPDQYVPVGGERKPGARASGEEFLRNNTETQASRVGLDASGNPTFIDGRHRFGIMRDHGLDVQVAVPRGSAEEFRAKFGADAGQESRTQPQPVTPMANRMSGVAFSQVDEQAGVSVQDAPTVAASEFPVQRPSIKLPIVDRPQEPDVYQIQRRMDAPKPPVDNYLPKATEALASVQASVPVQDNTIPVTTSIPVDAHSMVSPRVKPERPKPPVYTEEEMVSDLDEVFLHTKKYGKIDAGLVGTNTRYSQHTSDPMVKQGLLDAFEMQGVLQRDEGGRNYLLNEEHPTTQDYAAGLKARRNQRAIEGGGTYFDPMQSVVDQLPGESLAEIQRRMAAERSAALQASNQQAVAERVSVQPTVQPAAQPASQVPAEAAKKEKEAETFAAASDSVSGFANTVSEADKRIAAYLQSMGQSEVAAAPQMPAEMSSAVVGIADGADQNTGTVFDTGALDHLAASSEKAAQALQGVVDTPLNAGDVAAKVSGAVDAVGPIEPPNRVRAADAGIPIGELTPLQYGLDTGLPSLTADSRVGVADMAMGDIADQKGYAAALTERIIASKAEVEASSQAFHDFVEDVVANTESVSEDAARFQNVATTEDADVIAASNRPAAQTEIADAMAGEVGGGVAGASGEGQRKLDELRQSVNSFGKTVADVSSSSGKDINKVIADFVHLRNEVQKTTAAAGQPVTLDVKGFDALVKNATEARSAANDLKEDFNKASESASSYANRLSESHEKFVTGVSGIVRGATILGAMDDKALSAVIEKIAKVQGGIDIFLGITKTIQGLSQTVDNYSKSVGSIASAKEKQAEAEKAATAASQAEAKVLAEVKAQTEEMIAKLGRETQAVNDAADATDRLAKSRQNAAGVDYSQAGGIGIPVGQVGAGRALGRNRSRSRFARQVRASRPARAFGRMRRGGVGGVVRGVRGLASRGAGMAAQGVGFAAGVAGVDVAGVAGLSGAATMTMTALGALSAAIIGSTMAVGTVTEAIKGQSEAQNSLTMKIANAEVGVVSWVGKMTGLFDWVGDVKTSRMEKDAERYKIAGEERRENARIKAEESVAEGEQATKKIYDQQRLDAAMRDLTTGERIGVVRQNIDIERRWQAWSDDRMQGLTPGELDGEAGQVFKDRKTEAQQREIELKLELITLERQYAQEQERSAENEIAWLQKELDLNQKKTEEIDKQMKDARSQFAQMSEAERNNAKRAFELVKEGRAAEVGPNGRNLLEKIGTQDAMDAVAEIDRGIAEKSGFDEVFMQAEQKQKEEIVRDTSTIQASINDQREFRVVVEQESESIVGRIVTEMQHAMRVQEENLERRIKEEFDKQRQQNANNARAQREKLDAAG